MWNIREGKLIQTLGNHPEAVESVAFSPDSHYLLSTAYQAYLFDLLTREFVREYKGGFSFWDARFAPDSRTFVSGHPDGARFFDVTSGDELLMYDSYAQSNDPGAIFSVDYSPDGRYAILGDSSGYATLVDVSTGTATRVFGNAASRIFDVAYSPDGRTVATAFEDTTVRLWDVPSGIERHVFTGHTDSVISVRYSPDGRYLLSGSTDGTARIWDIEASTVKRVTLPSESPLKGADFSPDGRWFYVFSASEIRGWRTDYLEFIDFACEHLYYDFTEAERIRFNILDDEPTCPQFGD